MHRRKPGGSAPDNGNSNANRDKSVFGDLSHLSIITYSRGGRVRLGAQSGFGKYDRRGLLVRAVTENAAVLRFVRHLVAWLRCPGMARPLAI